MDIDDIEKRILENPLLDGVTFSGGEPLLQAAPLAELANRLKKKGLDITTYAGYVLKELREMAAADAGVAALLAATDVLIDGPYIEALRDLTLDFRGSSNQKIIRL